VETQTLSQAEQNLLRKPVFFNYAVQYHSTHEELPDDFRVTDAIVKEFRQRLTDVEGIELSDSDAEEARKFIDLRLTYEIVRAFQGEEPARMRVIDDDTEVMEAVHFIEKGKDLEGMFSLASRMSEETAALAEKQ